MRTVAEPVAGSEVRVEPADGDGITVNGAPATLEGVVKADRRVDLAGPDRSFVVEHVLGPLGLRGVTAARVTGVREAWSFERPEHRFCYSTDLGPEHVVGHPAGLPNPELADALGRVEVVGSDDRSRRTVSEPVAFGTDDGRIELAPAERGSGIEFDVAYGGASMEATVDPAGENDEGLIAEVTRSTTPYLAPDPDEAVVHSIADLVSDIAVIGGFDDLRVTADLGGAYHALTVGAAREARERGAVVER